MFKLMDARQDGIPGTDAVGDGALGTDAVGDGTPTLQNAVLPQAKAVVLDDDWAMQLETGDRERRLGLLPLIERFAVATPGAYMAVLPLCADADFAVRLRALLAVGRLGQGEAFLPLLPYLAEERLNHWRLAILDTLFVLPWPDKITPLLPFLAADHSGDGDAYFLSGLIWFFGNQGLPAIVPLIEQVLDKPVRARRVKDGLLAEAFFLAAGGDTALLTRLTAQYPSFYRFSSNRIWPKNLRPHYGIYPNPDYLLQKALHNGLSQRQFRSLYHWHRNKNMSSLRYSKGSEACL